MGKDKEEIKRMIKKIKDMIVDILSDILVEEATLTQKNDEKNSNMKSIDNDEGEPKNTYFSEVHKKQQTDTNPPLVNI